MKPSEIAVVCAVTLAASIGLGGYVGLMVGHERAERAAGDEIARLGADNAALRAEREGYREAAERWAMLMQATAWRSGAIERTVCR